MSICPKDTAHWSNHIIEWYFVIPLQTRYLKLSSSGWLSFSNWEVTLCLGFIPNIVMYSSIIFLIYFLGVPSSSQKKSHPKWYSIGPAPLSLNLRLWFLFDAWLLWLDHQYRRHHINKVNTPLSSIYLALLYMDKISYPLNNQPIFHAIWAHWILCHKVPCG